MNSSTLGEVYSLIRETEANGLLIEDAGLSGFSGEKIAGVLQRLSVLQSCQDVCCLEVGV